MVALMWTGTARAEDEGVELQESEPVVYPVVLKGPTKMRDQGMFVGGLISLVVGTGNLIGGTALLVSDPQPSNGGFMSVDSLVSDPALGTTLVALGAIGVGVGTGLMVSGAAEVPIAIWPSVAGEPGLTLSGSF